MMRNTGMSSYLHKRHLDVKDQTNAAEDALEDARGGYAGAISIERGEGGNLEMVPGVSVIRMLRSRAKMLWSSPTGNREGERPVGMETGLKGNGRRARYLGSVWTVDGGKWKQREGHVRSSGRRRPAARSREVSPEQVGQ